MRCWLLVALYATDLAAADFHVDPAVKGASDDNPGTPSQPWKTLAKAAVAAQSSDIVWIHAGTYPEAVIIRHPGTAVKPTTFRAFDDDAVNLEGGDAIPADKWQIETNSKSIYSTVPAGDPGAVFVDGTSYSLKMQIVSAKYPRTYKRGVLMDTDKGCYQYDADAKKLLVNLNGDPPEKHTILVPTRATAFIVPAGCRIAGIRANHFSGSAIGVGGDDAVVEDCLITDCREGISVAGWSCRRAIVRRNTIIGALENGIYLINRPSGSLIEDNLTIRCTLNPAHEAKWLGGIKMNSASDTIFAHNVVLESGNPGSDQGIDGVGLWGDINIARTLYVGNTCANNRAHGIYVEFGMEDTRAYFNTCYRNSNGLSCRASQRSVFMYNLVLESIGAGLAIFTAEPPYSTVDNIFAHNFVRGCKPSILFQTEQPAFSDYNTFSSTNLPFAVGTNGSKFNNLAEWARATGLESHSKAQNVRPEEIGLGTVSFRVADSTHPEEVLRMVGNGGCEFDDPVYQSNQPYFWRPGTGDDVPHVFSYAVENRLQGGIEAEAYGGAGATIGVHADFPSQANQPKMAHTGLRCLEINGQVPATMCKEGIGYWSPSLPARPGDTNHISYFVQGKDLKPVQNVAVTAFVEFTDATGQHRSRFKLPSGTDSEHPLSGTFGWIKLSAEVTVPANSRRLRVFLGLAPGSGRLFIDDIHIKVR